MKRLVTVTETEGEGLEALLGQKVLVMCASYFYCGMLVGVNTHDIILEDAGIVYSTGELNATSYSDYQKFPCKEWRVRTSSIESYGVSNVST